MVHVVFPLTPALSLGERENCSPSSLKNSVVYCAVRTPRLSHGASPTFNHTRSDGWHFEGKETDPLLYKLAVRELDGALGSVCHEEIVRGDDQSDVVFFAQ